MILKVFAVPTFFESELKYFKVAMELFGIDTGGVIPAEVRPRNDYGVGVLASQLYFALPGIVATGSSDAVELQLIAAVAAARYC